MLATAGYTNVNLFSNVHRILKMSMILVFILLFILTFTAFIYLLMLLPCLAEKT